MIKKQKLFFIIVHFCQVSISLYNPLKSRWRIYNLSVVDFLPLIKNIKKFIIMSINNLDLLNTKFTTPDEGSLKS